MQNPREIATIGTENFWAYKVPMQSVTDNGIETVGQIEIRFCKGDKSNPSVERQNGVFVESLLEACAHRLKGVNVGELSTRETSVAITKIEEAIMWLEKRSADRRARGVEQTYRE